MNATTLADAEARLDTKLAPLDEKTATLRDLVREANGATKDLRSEIREGREVAPQIVAEYLEAEVKAELARLSTITQKAMDDAVERVFKKFDDLAALLLGMTGPNRKRNDASVPELLAEFVADGGGRRG